MVSDFAQIDRILKEERKHVLGIVKKIVKSGANVLLVQKSILRDALSDLAIHFLSKQKIMVVKDIERTDVPFICQTLGCIPVAHIDNLTPEKLSTNAKIAQNFVLQDGAKVFHIDVEKSTTSTILVRGISDLVMDEAERSIHDALCVLRSLIKKRGIVPGGGAVEIEIWRALEQYAQSQKGVLSMVIQEYAQALEVIPFTLSQNCGLNPVRIVTEMRNKHLNGLKLSGLKARTGQIVDNALENKIMQPSLVTISALSLATEVNRMILKIDDIIESR